MGAKRVVASAAGTAALIYVALSGRLSSESDAARQRWRRSAEEKEEEEEERRWPERAPASWREEVAVLSRTAGFAYAETLGKWPLGDIAFGINHYMRIQGNLQHEYSGSNCMPLDGPGVRQELIELLRYLRLCMFFSKKPYEVFLEFGGYGQSDILLRRSKSQFMKPAFTVVRDESTKCFLLFIRGATSTKDRLTAATAAEVPFHHSVLQDGRRSNLMTGHAHCGMVAAARWIADQAIPCLTKAVDQFPDYRVKIIGHSMGAGIAAILTYMLREDNKLSSSSCIAFGPGATINFHKKAVIFLLGIWLQYVSYGITNTLECSCPAACMTWDLAESGKDFVTSVINKNDIVPSFGKASAANLRTEVMASSWAPDLQEQIQQTRILGFVNSSVNFMRSRIPFVSSAGSDHTPMDELNIPLSCWSSVAVNTQILALMSAYRGTEQNTEKLTTAGEPASCYPGELNRQKSDAVETDPKEKATDQERVYHLLKALRSSQMASKDPHQLYPPGRIMHMVELPTPKEPSTGEQCHLNEVVAIYETPRSMYGKIRPARTMITDHYMPRYINTMETLINKLAEDEDDTDNRLG